eukprot:m.98994 g.98994  ORF g.98994 m.98994 type:complete len:371 (-) comp27120_c1_seq1:124-1236(-)
MAAMTVVAVFLSSVTANAIPLTMHAIRTRGPCSSPFSSCVEYREVSTPTPKQGQALVSVNGSSVNPSDVDTVEGGACTFGCGSDFSGIVVKCPGCTRLKVGDQVWGGGSSAYAEYLTVDEKDVSLKPSNLDFIYAATVPEVGLTSLFSLKRTTSLPGTPLPSGSPWANKNFSNLTVIITAGSGGTGFMGIELAKVYGAVNILTATTGAIGFSFVKSLGATFVTDYMKEDLFDVLPDNSVDIVYDNYGAQGTADKAMRVLRTGGTYLLMPHGECFVSKSQAPPCLSANPKPGVRQINYVTGPDYAAYGLMGLQEMKTLFEANQLSAHISKSFALSNASAAFEFSAGKGQGGVNDHVGKISITTGAIPNVTV